MLKQLILGTCLAAPCFGLTACDASRGNGPFVPDIIVPSVQSTFVYDYEQRIIPVKLEDEDTTYKFELTAKVDLHEPGSDRSDEMIGVRLYDETGFDMPHLRYKLKFDQDGNLYYNEPYFSNTWTKLAFGTRASLTGPDTVIGDHSDYYQELRQTTTYLGNEVLTINGRPTYCEKIEWKRKLIETDPYTTKMGTYEEKQVFWFSKDLGFFVARETEYESFRLHKPKWKYTTKERLKRYSIEN